MGQYYKPINIKEKKWLYSHEYDNGLKLMEHSYLGNKFMNAVETLLMPNGAWHKCRIVWAGDYADPEKGEKDESKNLYHIIGKEKNKIKPESKEMPKEYRYIVNHDKKQFVDKTKIKAHNKEQPNFKIHPLSLLTSEGNGRGGGDFRKEDNRIGIWARDRISIEKELPESYEEIDGQFNEKM